MPATAARPTRSKARLAAFIGIPVALVVSGIVVAQASYSAYSANTANPTNNWSSGTVALSDDDSNAALFTASNLKPGQTGTKCIVVTSTGSLASSVKLYGTGYTTTNGLGPAINLVVTMGTGGSNGSCTGFTALASGSSVYSGTVAGLAGAATDFSSGLGTWNTTGTTSGEIRTYKVDYTLNASTTNATQAGTAALAFTWEAQNT